MRIEDQFVPYDLALKLKDVGFDEICLTSYNSFKEFVEVFATALEENATVKDCYVRNSQIHNQFVAAPLWQQVFDYFRERGYGIFIETWINNGYKKFRGRNDYPPLFFTDVYNTYEGARHSLLEKLINLEYESQNK